MPSRRRETAHPSVLQIARAKLGLETLERRRSEDQDVAHIHVDNLREALEAAYWAGRAAGPR